MIAERTQALHALHAEVFGVEPRAGRQTPAAPTAPNDLSDADLIDRAKRASNGARFAALWSGDASAYPSHSEADLALLARLSFWTGGDRVRMDRLFRCSGLYREKWDESHYDGDETYGEHSIALAVTGSRVFYRPTTVDTAGLRVRSAAAFGGGLVSVSASEAAGWLT